MEVALSMFIMAPARDIGHGAEGIGRRAGGGGRGAEDLGHRARDLEHRAGGIGHRAGAIGHQAGEEEGTTRSWNIVSGRKSSLSFPKLRKWRTTAVGHDGEAVHRGDGLAGEQEDGALGRGDGSMSARLQSGSGFSLCELAFLMLMLGVHAD